MTASQVDQARDRYHEAVRSERDLRVAAGPALRLRARRRAAAVRLGAVAAVIAAVVLVGVALWAGASARSADTVAADAESARSAAADAVASMLTADPADAREYVDRILGASVGRQRERLETGADQLVATVAGLDRRQHGTILSSGVRDRSADAARVVVVAQATDARLIGGDAADQRIGLLVSVVRGDGRWLVEDTEPVS